MELDIITVRSQFGYNYKGIISLNKKLHNSMVRRNFKEQAINLIQARVNVID